MAVARRQKQAQKQQEQQISKALAEPKASTSHVSFDDDDDDAQGTSTSTFTGAATPASIEGRSDDSDEDDDAPIEVVSNKTSRKQATQESAKLKAQEKAERAKRQAAEQKKAAEWRKEKQAAEDLQAVEMAAEDAEEEVSPSEEEAAGSDADEREEGPSNRLDPSLFAEVFSKPASAPKSILRKRSVEERADEVARLQRERKQRRKEQRAGGVVKGRDGMPMKRAPDGTVLRALNTSSSKHKTTFDDEDAEEPQEPLETLVRPEPLDPSVSLPNAKARAFKKSRLTHKRSKVSKAAAPAKKRKNEDDPLGLNDPAFLPGGEFYHLVNKGDKAKGAKPNQKPSAPSARQAFRGGGVRKDAVSVLRARSRGGPSLGFARSQQDDDDY